MFVMDWCASSGLNGAHTVLINFRAHARRDLFSPPNPMPRPDLMQIPNLSGQQNDRAYFSTRSAMPLLKPQRALSTTE